MKKSYLIAIDCDGTLVGDDLVLRERTVFVLRSLLQRGHYVVLASGRPYRSLEPFVKEIGLEKMPIVTYNGAHAFSLADPSFVYSKAFNLAAVKDIATRLLPEVDSLLIDDAKKAYLKVEDPYLNQFFPYRELPYAVDEGRPHLENPPYVIVFKRKNASDEPYRSIIEAHEGLRYRAWRDSLYAEAYQEGSDKGHALKAVMDYLKVDSSHLVAIGDSDNDLPMLALAGHAYRMPESRQSALLGYEAAPDTAENEGVAKLLASLPFLA